MNQAISSDDPNAIEKLREKLAALERTQKQGKAINKALKKSLRIGNDQPLRDMKLADTTIEVLKTPDYAGRIGVPAYELTNRNANIRRIKQRIKDLEASAGDTTTEKWFGPVTVVDSVEDNRLQVFFPGKPNEATRTDLKRCGFKWSPTSGAWQRFRGSDATYWGEAIATAYASNQVA